MKKKKDECPEYILIAYYDDWTVYICRRNRKYRPITIGETLRYIRAYLIIGNGSLAHRLYSLLIRLLTNRIKPTQLPLE